MDIRTEKRHLLAIRRAMHIFEKHKGVVRKIGMEEQEIFLRAELAYLALRHEYVARQQFQAGFIQGYAEAEKFYQQKQAEKQGPDDFQPLGFARLFGIEASLPNGDRDTAA